MTIKDWLRNASNLLQSTGIASARLDAELLLAHALNKPREYIFAHPETLHLRGTSSKELEMLLERRAKREPMAYILGSKEFYGRNFVVTPDVLIPRPESEMMIDLLKQIVEDGMWNVEGNRHIIDVGTGSGCLAITAKLELPDFEVVAVDNSEKAIKIAKDNAGKHRVEIEFFHGSLLEPILPTTYYLLPDIILANLPYVDKTWDVSPETHYEPDLALYAADKGLSLIKKLINQASQVLEGNGYLILEADPRQHKLIVDFSQYAFHLKNIRDFIVVLQKK